jgi:hypothetical protein
MDAVQAAHALQSTVKIIGESTLVQLQLIDGQQGVLKGALTFICQINVSLLTFTQPPLYRVLSS